MWSIVSLMAWFTYSPSSLPVEFKQDIGQLVSAKMEDLNGTERFTITLNTGEIDKKFVELNDIWLNIDNINDSASASMTEKFNEIKNTTQSAEALGIKADIDPNIKGFSLTPQFK